MHDDMVERVALAISGSDDPANILSIHRHRARAAIEAMRLPTREMVNAGAIDIERAGNDETNSTFELWNHEVIAVWQAMIDAALQKDAART